MIMKSRFIRPTSSLVAFKQRASTGSGSGGCRGTTEQAEGAAHEGLGDGASALGGVGVESVLVHPFLVVVDLLEVDTLLESAVAGEAVRDHRGALSNAMLHDERLDCLLGAMDHGKPNGADHFVVRAYRMRRNDPQLTGRPRFLAVRMRFLDLADAEFVDLQVVCVELCVFALRDGAPQHDVDDER
jgi:hypothetical protein